MARKKYSYAAEKLNAARHGLMLPHPQGESESLKYAFHECSLGLKDLGPDDFDDDARRWVRTIRETMDTTGVEDPAGVRGTWAVKADGLTVDQKLDFSRAVDELAHWLDRHLPV